MKTAHVLLVATTVTLAACATTSPNTDTATGPGQLVNLTLQPARVSPNPLQPTRISLLLLSLVAAVVMGFVASFAADKMAPTFHDARELAAVANRPTLGWLSMVETPSAQRRKRDRLIMFAGGLGALGAAFAGVFALVLMAARAG